MLWVSSPKSLLMKKKQHKKSPMACRTSSLSYKFALLSFKVFKLFSSRDSPVKMLPGTWIRDCQDSFQEMWDKKHCLCLYFLSFSHLVAFFKDGNFCILEEMMWGKIFFNHPVTSKILLNSRRNTKTVFRQQIMSEPMISHKHSRVSVQLK